VKGQNILQGNMAVDLFPEPVTSGKLNLAIHSDESILSSEITIFDLLGRSLLSKTVAESEVQLDLKTMHSGNFILQYLIHSTSGIHRISKIFQVIRE
jgi:hypothetical protein